MDNTKLHFDNLFLSDPVYYEQIRLYQAGDCITKVGFQIEDHNQICDEISYIVSGEAEFFLNGESYKVCAGDLFFCSKNSIHKIVSNKENPVRYFYLGYRFLKDHPSYEKWYEIDRGLKSIKKPICHRAFNMNHLFSDLLCGFQQEFNKKEMLIELSAWQIILHTYKYFTTGEQNAAVYNKRIPGKKELAYEIVNYIDNNILRIKNLNDISRYIGFSYSYTSQIFNSVMHISLSDYYQKKRFEEALKLIKSGVSVTQTSEIMGYDSVHSFSRAFKLRFGASPQNYIKSIEK